MATKKITFDPEAGVAYPCDLIMNVGADFSATFNVVDTANTGFNFSTTNSVGLNTVTSVGVNTATVNDKDLQGIGNTFNGMYISNGMMIYDNALSGNHYIGTAFNGLMAGPVTIHGTLSVDGQYVVV